ncbi:hypothetical protein GCM10023069_13690 [Shinella granuli]
MIGIARIREMREDRIPEEGLQDERDVPKELDIDERDLAQQPVRRKPGGADGAPQDRRQENRRLGILTSPPHSKLAEASMTTTQLKPVTLRWPIEDWSHRACVASLIEVMKTEGYAARSICSALGRVDELTQV